MSQFEQSQLESDLKRFTDRNFESPSRCKNPEQIRFYVQELCAKIKEYESKFNFVPNWAYSLLSEYNQVQNQMVYIHFRNTYK